MAAKTQRLVGFSKTGGVARRAFAAGSRPVQVNFEDLASRRRPALETALLQDAERYRLDQLVAEWLLDLQVQGRATRTLETEGLAHSWPLASVTISADHAAARSP